MAQRKQLRVGTQWLYSDDAEKLLREAIRLREQEEQQHRISGHTLPFWRKYIFSTDHKWIGIQYGVTALFFLLFGFSLMMSVRNLALFGTDWFGSVLLETYNVPFSSLVIANSVTTLMTVPLVLLLPAILISKKDAELYEEAPAPRTAPQA